MTVPAEKLKMYYALKSIGSDGAASPELTVDSGTDQSIVDATLTQADDYWNGALLIFESDTTTSGLRNVVAHVKDFIASTDTLVLAKPLPASVQAGDTFRLYLGGNYRTATKVRGLTATGLSNVTGVVIDYAGYLNGEGNGTLDFTASGTLATWQAPGDSNPGSSVDIGSNGSYVLYSEDENKWIEITVVAASLPGGDESDTIALVYPDEAFLPDFEGYETVGSGKIRYHLAVVKNEDGSDTMIDLRAFLSPADPGTATTLSAGKDTGEGSVAVADASDWPTRSFWVKNTTKNDLAYCKYRTGNTLFLASRVGGLRGHTAQSWDSSDAVIPYPEVDIGLDAPATNQFESPTNETTAPSGVTFSAPTDYDNGLAIGNLAAGALYGVWVRETVVQGVYSRDAFTPLIHFQWS